MSTLKTISWGAVILWMALIFHLSHQPADRSNELSQGITEVIIEKIEKVMPAKEFDFRRLHHLLRKNAHFLAYLVLGILVLNALRRSGIQGYRSMGIALLVCVLYAISDEVHQLYVPGRSGEVRDVIIDTIGASMGITLYQIASGLGNRIIRRKQP